MIFERRDKSLPLLRQANPRNQAGFDAVVAEHEGLREQIVSAFAGVAGDARVAPRRPVRSAPYGTKPARRPRRRVLGLSATGAAVVVASVVAAVLLLTGGPGGLTTTPVFAAEAVKKVAVDTVAAARSGVIRTVLTIDGEAQVDNLLSWNGDDLSLVVQDDSQRQLRYVDGLYYETYGYSVPIETGDTQHLEQWIHCTDYDEGGTPDTSPSAVETPDPQGWLSAARADLAGTGLLALVTGAEGYVQTEAADGSVTYAGSTTVSALQSQDWGASGLPVASRPSFKVRDPATPVAIRVSVSADGLMKQLTLDWTLAEPGEASRWSFTASYSNLGTAASIVAPDPEHTVTTDNRLGN